MMIDPMDVLRSNLSRVRIPEPTNRIYKQECCLTFDTPRSDGGLFIDMYTLLAFGKDCVAWNYEKTGDPVYLHIKQTKKIVPEDRPSKKPALLAIGVDGGFDNNEPEYEETHSIVILPDYVSLPFPSVELPEKVRLAADAILLAEGAERKEQVAAWTADKKQVSAYAMNLQQIDNGVIIPPSGWKCAKCEHSLTHRQKQDVAYTNGDDSEKSIVQKGTGMLVEQRIAKNFWCKEQKGTTGGTPIKLGRKREKGPFFGEIGLGLERKRNREGRRERFRKFRIEWRPRPGEKF